MDATSESREDVFCAFRGGAKSDRNSPCHYKRNRKKIRFGRVWFGSRDEPNAKPNRTQLWFDMEIIIFGFWSRAEPNAEPERTSYGLAWKSSLLARIRRGTL
jgi:hypothetical protein